MKTWIGIDNGVSGALGIIWQNGPPVWEKMPVRRELNYTKAKKFINRVDVEKLRKIMCQTVTPCMALIERPMVNPGRFQATLSAMRALEATLLVLEEFKIPYRYIDSREWQKTQLPSGLEGPELKQASIDVARRLWPDIHIPKGCDADALLIARHGQIQNH